MNLFRIPKLALPRFATYIAIACLLVSSTVYGYDEGSRKAPLIQAGRLAEAPNIDGVVNEAEWAGAGTVNMFHLLNSDSIYAMYPTARVAFDQSYLYIAVTVPIPAGTQLTAPTRDRDGTLWADDTVEIFLDPLHNHTDDYQLSVNAAGSIQDSRNQNNDWNGEWTSAVSKTEKNWQLEVKIPLATLGLDNVQTRKIVGFNIALDRTKPMTSNHTWAPLLTGGFHQVQLFGHLVLDPAGFGASGKITGDGSSLFFTADVVPPDQDVEAALYVYRDGVLLNQVKQKVGTGTRLGMVLPENKANYRYEAEIIAADKQLLYSSGVIDAAAFEPLHLALRKFFVQGKLAVDVAVGDLVTENPPYDYTVSIVNDSGKQLVSKSIKKSKERTVSVDFDISRYPFTRHTVEVVLADSSGNKITSASQSYTRPQIPRWVGSKAGKSDKVLPPWTPLKTTAAKNAISVAPWGRVYKFKGMPFPSSVWTRNADVLNGPIVMRLSINGKSVDLKGNLKIKQKSGSRIVLVGNASASGIKAVSTVAIDFDGNADVLLKLYAAKKLTIDRFSIEAPIRNKHALYRYYFPGTWGSSANARALPKTGWKSDYVPYVWVGDNDRGFALYSTSDKNWIKSEKLKPVEIVPVGKNTMALRFNIISKPVVVQAGKVLDYALGFEATPVKNPDKDVWDYRICHLGSYSLPYTFAGQQTSVVYPAGSGFDPAKGSIEMWAKVNFDPTQPIVDEGSRGALNQDFLTIQTSTQTLGFYWNIDVQGMRLYLKDGTSYPVMLDKQTFWKANELHHLAFTWGDEIKVYIDGKLAVSQKYKGLLTGPASDVTISFAGQNPGFSVDELRISNIAREITLPDSPYTADEHTVLLDHFDNIRKIGANRFESLPAKGTPANIVGTGTLVDGKFGKAIATVGEKIPMLDHLKAIGVRTIIFHENWTEYQNYTETINNQERLKNLVKMCHDKGMQVLLYFGYEISNIAPEFEDYHNEMLVMPIAGAYTREPAQIARIVCYNSDWQDFMADGIDKMIQKYDIDGVYLDGTSWPWACMNTSHGCGYTRPDGSLAPTYSIKGARDMMRRLYTVVKTRKPDGQVNLHNSLTMVAPTIGWATSTWDGEQFGFMNTKVDMEELFPLDAFRTEFMGRQWGVPAELLCYDIPFTQHQAFSFSMLHDVLVRGVGPGLEEESLLWKTMDAFGRKQAEFIPYFSNSNLVKVSGKHSYCSMYVRQGKGVMCVVSNLGADASDITVKLDLAKMKLGKNIEAENVMTGQKLELQNGSFTVNLKSFDYALVWIK